MSETRKAEVISELSNLLGARYVLHSAYDLTMYEYDASIDRGKPEIVVMPSNSEEVAADR